MIVAACYFTIFYLHITPKARPRHTTSHNTAPHHTTPHYTKPHHTTPKLVLSFLTHLNQSTHSSFYPSLSHWLFTQPHLPRMSKDGRSHYAGFLRQYRHFATSQSIQGNEKLRQKHDFSSSNRLGLTSCDSLQ